MNLADWMLFISIIGLMLYGVWRFIPRILFAFLPNSLKFYFENNDKKALKRKQLDKMSSSISAIESLGFVQLGIKTEKFPLWGSKVSELSLASANAHSFAAVFSSRDKIVYYFLTPFREGQIVLTANSNFANFNTKDIIQTAVSNAKPSELLLIHQNNVEEVSIKGSTVFKEYTRQTRIEATSLYYKLFRVRKQLRIAGLTNLFFLIIFCFPFLYLIINVII